MSIAMPIMSMATPMILTVTPLVPTSMPIGGRSIIFLHFEGGGGGIGYRIKSIDQRFIPVARASHVRVQTRAEALSHL